MNRVKLTDMVFGGRSVSSVIAACERVGVCIGKYNDPVEEALENISAAKANEVAREDPGLLWINGGSAWIVLTELEEE